MAIKRKTKRQMIAVENLLRHYHYYKSGIKNLKKQLDYIMPGITANYEIQEGSTGSFVIQSKTEKYAIDRIESKRALDIYEKIQEYEIIVSSIESSLEVLSEEEKQFVTLRYFENKSIKVVAYNMNCSERSVFNIRENVLHKLSISLSGILENL
ncbi:sigma factor-like helix-turn-helix DNA-binding protein [Aeribacillus pallidus]|uniref:sigma factor-like helix-turn-helix DNA-binding protein n=1 Tax=Aeribacillus pallidus TaxID=33936 RepID=UPI003D1F9B9D